MVGVFSLAACTAPESRLATPGPLLPITTAGLPVMRHAASAMEEAASSRWGAATFQPRDSAWMNIEKKLGSGMPNRLLMPSASNSSMMRSWIFMRYSSGKGADACRSDSLRELLAMPLGGGRQQDQAGQHRAHRGHDVERRLVATHAIECQAGEEGTDRGESVAEGH